MGTIVALLSAGRGHALPVELGAIYARRGMQRSFAAATTIRSL